MCRWCAAAAPQHTTTSINVSTGTSHAAVFVPPSPATGSGVAAGVDVAAAAPGASGQLERDGAVEAGSAGKVGLVCDEATVVVAAASLVWKGKDAVVAVVVMVKVAVVVVAVAVAAVVVVVVVVTAAAVVMVLVVVVVVVVVGCVVLVPEAAVAAVA